MDYISFIRQTGVFTGDASGQDPGVKIQGWTREVSSHWDGQLGRPNRKQGHQLTDNPKHEVC